jgi:hypothetical protein
MKCIAYIGGYKYQFKHDYMLDISIKPDADIVSEFISLSSNGALFIKCGYAWDGPSGPTIDTQNFMRGSLIHDALYQLMRERHLDNEIYSEKADRLLREHCKEDGMTSIRAWWVYQGVRFGGGSAADPGQDRPRQANQACTQALPVSAPIQGFMDESNHTRRSRPTLAVLRASRLRLSLGLGRLLRRDCQTMRKSACQFETGNFAV